MCLRYWFLPRSVKETALDLSSWLADGLHLSVCLHVIFLLCVTASVSQLFLFIRTSFIFD